jgi:hypothetical protein
MTEGKAGISGFIDVRGMAKENRAALEHIARILENGTQNALTRLDALGSVTRRFIR